MSDWYYAAGNDQRMGPLPTDELLTQFRQGLLGLGTLVWREGQAQWQPLSDFAEELGLATGEGTPLPPPLPPLHARTTPASAPPAARMPGAGVQQRPKSGLSGCMIALIILAVLAIPVIAILAAIALPAYNDYVQRAHVAGAVQAAEPLKRVVEAHVSRERTCPGNDDADFSAPEDYAAGNLASVSFGPFESELCGMELILAVPGKAPLDGKAVWLEYDPSDSSWQCSSEIDDRYLPAHCRG